MKHRTIEPLAVVLCVHSAAPICAFGCHRAERGPVHPDDRRQLALGVLAAYTRESAVLDARACLAWQKHDF